MRLSGTARFALALVVAGGLAGCGGGSVASDGGGGSAGEGGVGMPPAVVDPMDLLSDFEQGRAAILPLGSPARNGYWYSYNDRSGNCLQSPAHGELTYASTPPARAPGLSGGRALHGNWNRCASWGGGMGADLAGPPDEGEAPARPRMPYDLRPYAGVAFWGMAAPGTETTVRLKVVMRVSTQIEDGGACDESVLGLNQCGDEWGAPFSLPGDGTWHAVTVRFSDASFRQEGWGRPFAWNPADVFGLQFQSVDTNPGALYDIWIDDIYLVR